MDVQTLGMGGPHVVALHGIQGTRRSWLSVADRLATSGRIVLPNLRGRGTAYRGHGERDYGLAQFADDLDTVTSTLPDEPFFLAGWSMGVSVALDYLARAEARRPAGVMLLSGSPCLAQTSWFQGRGDDLLAEVAAREARLGLTEAADHDAVAWTWEAISQTDQRGLLGGLDMPVLVLHGSEDEDSPWQHGRWLAEGIPGATLVTLAGAGHSILTTHTAEVAQHLGRFIEETLE